MATLVRKTRLGNPTRPKPQDVTWYIEPDGTGKPGQRGDPGTLEAGSKYPADAKLIRQGKLIYEKNRAMDAHDIEEFDGGTAIRETDGSISYHDRNLIVEP